MKWSTRPKYTYAPDLSTSDIVLKWQDGNITFPDDLMLQILPNPVYQEAKVRFYLKQDGFVSIHFYDISGRSVYEIEKPYLAGHHEERIGTQYLGPFKSMMYCQLISGSSSDVKKFLITE